MTRYNFNDSIAKAFEEFGIEAMLSNRIISIIMDFGGFEEKPALKNIVKSFINDGYATKLYDMKLLANQNKSVSFTAQIQNVIYNFTESSGYNEKFVKQVVCTFACNLGLIDNNFTEIHTFDSNTDNGYQIAKKTPNITSNANTSNMYTGSLNVDVKPYNSIVFLNGKEKGVTPLVISDLHPGDYMLRVVNSEGSQKDSIQTIKSGETTSVVDNIFSLVMSDYSLISVGDYVYSDGSFSKEVIVKGKQCIGQVVTLETSPMAKKKGYVHGQIMLWQSLNYEKFTTIEKTFPGTFPIMTEDQVLSRARKNNPLIQLSGFDVCQNTLFRDNDFYPCLSKLQDVPPFPFSSKPYLPSLEDMLSILFCTCKKKKASCYRDDRMIHIMLNEQPVKFDWEGSITVTSNGHDMYFVTLLGDHAFIHKANPYKEVVVKKRFLISF